jgi:uncharacterized protein (TIGR02145 family)
MLKFFDKTSERDKYSGDYFKICPDDLLLPFQIMDAGNTVDCYLVAWDGTRTLLAITIDQEMTIYGDYLHIYSESGVTPIGCGVFSLELEFGDRTVYSEWFETQLITIGTNTRDWRVLPLPVVFGLDAPTNDIDIYFAEGNIPAFQHLEKGTTTDAKLYLVNFDTGEEWEITPLTADVEGDYVRYLIEQTANEDVLICHSYYLKIVDGGLTLYSQRWGTATVPPPPAPVIELSGELFKFSAVVEQYSPTQDYEVSGYNLIGLVEITAPANFQVSLNGANWFSSVAVAPVGGVLAATTIYVRFKASTEIRGFSSIGHNTPRASTVFKIVEYETIALTTINYGLLYNWYAVDDARNIAAEGWGVPDRFDVQTFIKYVDNNWEVVPWLPDAVKGLDNANQIKESGTIYWNNDNGINTVQFNARGAGARLNTGEFPDIAGINVYRRKNMAIFWITDDYIDDPTQSYMFYVYDEDSFIDTSVDLLEMGLSIRLLRSTPYDAGTDGVLADGDAAYPYTGNDGKVYRTVKIGTQIWLADNLAETKWRTGAYIQGWGSGGYEVIGNAAWAALTTAALCAYNNDTNNI